MTSSPHVHNVVLHPAQREAHQRNVQRTGTSRVHTYIDEGIRLIYEQLDAVVGELEQHGWLVLDTTVLSGEATVSTMLHHVPVGSHLLLPTEHSSTGLHGKGIQ